MSEERFDIVLIVGLSAIVLVVLTIFFVIQPTDSTQTELSPTFSMRHEPKSIRYRKQLVPPTIDQDEPTGCLDGNRTHPVH
jgi:hypothetical protein